MMRQELSASASAAGVAGSDTFDKPLVTVVIPVFNGADLVSRAVDSVLIQEGCELEVIVVDDGSTDLTPQILEKYGNTINVIRQANIGSKGIGRNRNLAARAGRGEWIAFLDHDDYWERGKLSKQLEVLKSVDADVIYTNVVNIGEVDRVSANAYSSDDLPSGDIFENLLCDNFVFTSSVIVRRTAFERVGGFDESGLVVEDWDLWLRLAASGSSFIGVPDLLTRYTWRDNSASKNHAEMCGLRRKTLDAALNTHRGREVSWVMRRKARANVEATNAWFVSRSSSWLALRMYCRALEFCPYRIGYFKSIIKLSMGRL